MAASFGDGENFTKKLEDFAVSKGLNKPAYSVVPQIVAGSLSYSCFVTVSTDFVCQPRLKWEALADTVNNFNENSQEVSYLTCSVLYKHV